MTISRYVFHTRPREGTEPHDRASARSGRCLSRSPKPVSSSAAGAMWFRTSSARYCAISADAERRRSALISNDAIAATMKDCRLRLVPQPALPQVSVLSTRSLAHEAGLKPAAGALRFMWSSPYPSNWHPTFALRNQRLFYNLLFRAASETLLEIAADPRHLGARIPAYSPCCTPGLTGTWDIIPTCTVSFPPVDWRLDRSRWVRSNSHFFLPVRVLSRMFRGKLLASLKQSYRHNQVLLLRHAGWALSAPRAFHSLLSAPRSKVGSLLQASLRRSRTCAQVPGPLHPSRRHLQRVGCSAPENGQVRFRWRHSWAQQPEQRHKASQVTEFIRRFLLSISARRLRQDPPLRPALLNRNRSQALALCRAISTPSPRTAAHCADRAGEVRTQPVLPPVQARHSAPAPALPFLLNRAARSH